MLLTLPKNLIINVRRFKHDHYGIQKDRSKLKFPLNLVLDRYILKIANVFNLEEYNFNEVKKNDERPQDLYELYGVVVHHGTLDAGHYTSYISNIQNGRKIW